MKGHRKEEDCSNDQEHMEKYRNHAAEELAKNGAAMHAIPSKAALLYKETKEKVQAIQFMMVDIADARRLHNQLAGKKYVRYFYFYFSRFDCDFANTVQFT